MAGDVQPDLAGYLARARSGNVVPVVWEAVSDLDTPIGLYAKLRPLGAAYLLESAEQGRFGRYSFIGVRPFATLEADLREVRVRYAAGDAAQPSAAEAAGDAAQPSAAEVKAARGAAQPSAAEVKAAGGAAQPSAAEVKAARDAAQPSAPGATLEVCAGNPLEVLRELLRRFVPAAPAGLPPFWGGAVGFFGYELIHHLEDIPRLPDDGTDWPEAAFLLTEQVVVVDHLRHRLLVIHAAPRRGDPAAAYGRALEAIARTRAALEGPLPAMPPLALPPPGPTTGQANMTAEAHAAMVAAARGHIRVGDIFQVVLSQRLSRPFAGEALQVYRVLRAVNPSPYMYLLDFGAYQLVGASPEMLVRVQDGVVETRPIAGTRPRGASPAEDAALEAELRADPKEVAEHVMLVDLGRNDIGRVAVPGTVQVPEQLVIERFSHVMHLVSGVRGRLRPELDAFAALAACFPAGTLTGAPKVRAMEIIAALEPHRRGPYGGCVAYFSYDGNADTAICIRTLALRDGVASVQAGGGIVYDSRPAAEYQESLNKASAVLRALEAVEGVAASRPPGSGAATGATAAATAGGTAAPAAGTTGGGPR